MVNQVSLDINSMVVSIHRKLQRHGVVVSYHLHEKKVVAGYLPNT